MKTIEVEDGLLDTDDLLDSIDDRIQSDIFECVDRESSIQVPAQILIPQTGS